MKKTIVRYRNRSQSKRHAKAKMTMPLAVIGGLMPFGSTLLSAYRQGGVDAVVQHASMMTTGYDPTDGKVKFGYAVQKLYGPLAIGFLAHKLASRLGLNRALGAAGVPLFRI